MTAKEMFEAMGYEQTANNDNLIEYLLEDRDEEIGYYFIRFYLIWTRKSYTVGSYNGRETKTTEPMGVSIRKHKAITKQMEELGWI